MTIQRTKKKTGLTLAGCFALALACLIGGTAMVALSSDDAVAAPKTEKMSRQLEKDLKKIAKRKISNPSQTTVVTYRDIKGNAVQLTNPDLNIIEEVVSGMDITVDYSGLDLEGKRVTRVIPAVTIHADGSDCFWYCEKNGSVTCYKICI